MNARVTGAGLVLMLMCVCVPLAAQEKLIHTDSLLAIVGDYLITTYDVTSSTRAGEEYLSLKYVRDDALLIPREKEALEEEMLRYRHAVARELVSRELVFAEFKRRGYQLPPEIVAERLSRIIAKRANGDALKFSDWLREQQTTLNEFKETLKKQLSVELLTAQQVDRTILISPRDVELYYANHQDDFRIPGKVTLQLLSFPTAGLTAEALAAKVAEVNQALARGTFSEAVVACSQGYNREAGGLLPETQVEELNEAYRKAIAGLRNGDTSKPFAHAGAMTWLHVKALEPGTLPPLAEVRAKVEQLVEDEQKAERYTQFIRDLRRHTYVRIYFTEE